MPAPRHAEPEVDLPRLSPIDAAPDAADLEHVLEEHRADLTGYCYRMLGSPFEAEDAVQEALVRAWRAADRFEGRAALRSWLFRIATNVCVDMLNARRRRALPMQLGPPSPGDRLPGAPLAEHLWIGPINDDRVLPSNADPADVAIARDTIRLAFVAALQHLTPKQRAALLLRDVLRWKAKEIATLLGTTTVSVESQVRRARAVLADVQRGVPSGSDGAVNSGVLDQYVDAFERYDVDALVSLLHEDVTLSMPPHPLWLRGVDEIRTWFGTIHDDCRRARYVPVRVNGAPGLALYKPVGDGGTLEAFGVQVVEQSAGKIIGIHAFLDRRLFAAFDLPRTIAAERGGQSADVEQHDHVRLGIAHADAAVPTARHQLQPSQRIDHEACGSVDLEEDHDRHVVSDC